MKTMTPKERAMAAAANYLLANQWKGSPEEKVIAFVNQFQASVRVGRSAEKNADAVFESWLADLYVDQQREANRKHPITSKPMTRHEKEAEELRAFLYGNRHTGGGSNIGEFNTTLAKLLGKLKKDTGAVLVRQAYKGTGSKSHQRQIFVRYPTKVTDIWLTNHVTFNPGYNDHGPLGTHQIQYGAKSPEEVYAEIVTVLKPWAADSGKRHVGGGVTTHPLFPTIDVRHARTANGFKLSVIVKRHYNANWEHLDTVEVKHPETRGIAKAVHDHALVIAKHYAKSEHAKRVWLQGGEFTREVLGRPAADEHENRHVGGGKTHTIRVQGKTKLHTVKFHRIAGGWHIAVGGFEYDILDKEFSKYGVKSIGTPEALTKFLKDKAHHRHVGGGDSVQSVADIIAERRRKAEEGNWVPASGGTEKPFVTRTRRRLQYLWQPSTGRHAYIDLDTDIILSDEEALAALAIY